MAGKAQRRPRQRFNHRRKKWVATYVPVGPSRTRATARATAGAREGARDLPLPVFSIVAGAIGTGALVGPRVLLTAGHCVVDRPKAKLGVSKSDDRLFEAGNKLVVAVPGGKVAQARCFVHEDYLRTGAGDLALCLLDKDLGVGHTAVSLDADLLTPGDLLQLLGTGHIASGGSRPVRDMQARITAPADQDFVETELVNEADDLEGGDSGGPAMAVVDGGRVVVAAISRESPKDKATIAQLNGAVATRLLNQWKARGFSPVSFASSSARLTRRLPPMRPEIRRLTTEQFLSLLAAVQPGLERQITAVHLHHTWRPNRAQFRGLASIQGMRDYHIGLGWDDIGQHLTIDPSGVSWTGRNWNLPPASQKGKNGRPDAGPFMIEMVGDFDAGHDALDGDQRVAVCNVVAGILKQCGLDPKDVYFHRELGSPKTCPGTGVDKPQVIADIRAALVSLRAAGAGAGARPAGRSSKAKAKAKPPVPLSLPLPLEFLVSRDVADPVGRPAPSYADQEVPEDGASARAIAAESEARARAFAPDDVAALIARATDEWLELRPHVVNLSQGKLSRSGRFTMDEQSIAEIIDGIRGYAQSTASPRVMLHAHGGLVDEKSALEYARAAYKWWLHHGVYPIYFIWETGAFEIIKNRLGLGRGLGDWWDRRFERFARPLARPLWDDMKDYALKSSAVDAGGGEAGGARIFAQALGTLLANPPDGKPITLHPVGHSAGAIFHSHFVPMLIDGSMAVDSLAFLAPAVRIDLFKQMLVPHLASAKVRRFEMYTMDEEAEKDDDLIEPLGIPVYGKSLLYLVSNAFEPETKKAAILGLDERFRTDPEITGLFKPAGTHSLEFSHAKGKPHNPATHARMHGCFDNDDATMRSVLASVTGLQTTVPFPVADKRCDKAASRALGIGLDGGRGIWTSYFPSIAPAIAPSIPEIRAGTASGARRALCVGIDSYPTSPLAGCVRDAQNWAQGLRGLGFDVTTVIDRDATRQRVLDALHALVVSARAGDSLVFQYSGHGTQAEDLNGDERDRYDEALVPIDYTSGALLLDDDLAEVYRRLPDGAVLTLFMDCCHSGTNSRFAPLDRSVPRGDERRRFLELTADLQEAHRRFRARARAPEPTSAEESLPGLIHFAACLDNQFAYESGGEGHFTRVAAAALAAAVARGQTNEDFGSDVAAQVIGLGRPQTPRLMRLPAGLDGLALLTSRRAAAGGATGPVPGRPASGSGATLDDRATAEWWLQFFEAGAAHWRQRLGR
jgi:hypothetical protein